MMLLSNSLGHAALYKKLRDGPAGANRTILKEAAIAGPESERAHMRRLDDQIFRRPRNNLASQRES